MSGVSSRAAVTQKFHSRIGWVSSGALSTVKGLRDRLGCHRIVTSAGQGLSRGQEGPCQPHLTTTGPGGWYWPLIPPQTSNRHWVQKEFPALAPNHKAGLQADHRSTKGLAPISLESRLFSQCKHLSTSIQDCVGNVETSKILQI